jgi:hypothetical protein
VKIQFVYYLNSCILSRNDYFFDCRIPNVNFQQNVELSKVSEFLELEELSKICLENFSESLNEENIFKLYNSVILEQHLMQFKDEFVQFFCETIDELIFSKEFELLEKNFILQVYRRRMEHFPRKKKKFNQEDHSDESSVSSNLSGE